ncbi:MAG: endonuclease III [Porphyromonas sp.]|nr:endonuclease III [Porphyromonas sp.]
MTKKERYEAVIAYFSEAMPIAETELDYATPYELLVAVILSAQCTDKRVNIVTPSLFLAYPTIHDLAKAEPDEVYHYIRSISYPNNKAKHLVAMARMVIDRFGGEIPSTREELVQLPGVGRKTANVICAVIYHQPTMAVDTHVYRVSKRIGLAPQTAKTPLQVESELTRYLPEEIIPKAHHWLILHGRYVCTSRKPRCEDCGLTAICRYYGSLAKRKTLADAIG